MVSNLYQILASVTLVSFLIALLCLAVSPATAQDPANGVVGVGADQHNN